MCLFTETIRIEKGKAERLDLHNARMNRTRRAFFGACSPIDLRTLVVPGAGGEGLVRCRVVYGKDIEDISYAPYRMCPVSSLRLTEAGDTDYTFKYADRVALERLFRMRGEADDILMVKDGLLTDTSIANIALFDGEKWYTPDRPLLKGTRRASLLEEGLVAERTIPVSELFSYSEITLFNAMIPFGAIRFAVDTQHILE